MKKISKKGYKHKFYGRKKKLSIRFFYDFLMFAIVCLSLFLIISIYFSVVDYVKRSQIITEKKEMQFMFIDNQGMKYDIEQETNEHGSNGKRDYLFQDYTTGQIIGTGIISTGNVIKTGNILNTGENLSTGNIEVVKIEKKTATKLNIEINTATKLTETPKKNCNTPRGKILEHGKSVLAYQQRNDAPDVCNIQRRICNDGVLGGNFQQKSCKTNIPYNYTRGEVILYNEKKIDPLVQPSKDLPINKGAYFDNQGKIKAYPTPDTVRDNDKDTTVLITNVSASQDLYIQPNCVSPWGGIILNGQFVKAYKYKNGFIDYPCEVQLRPCMQGTLEGSYTNASCKHRDISYQDFIGGYFDKEQPSMLRIIETLNKDISENELTIQKGSIWEMIGNLWK